MRQPPILAEPDRIHAVVDDVARALEEGRRFVLVQGGFGSGRSLVCSALQAREPGRFAAVETLDLREPEAGLDGLYLAAASLEGAEARRDIQKDWPSLADGLRCLAGYLGTQRILLLRLPDSWEAAGLDEEEEGEWVRQRVERARELLGAVAATRDLRIVLVGPAKLRSALALKPDALFSLRRPQADLNVLADASRWGSYAPAAAALHARLTGRSPINPVVLRLAVGAVGLGVAPDAVRAAIEQGSDGRALRDLAQFIASRLREDQPANLQTKVQRLLLPRRPLPQAQILRFVQTTEEHTPLFTECIGQGDTMVRVHPAVRSALGNTLRRSSHDGRAQLTPEEDHASLAGLYRELDGQPHVWQTFGDETLCWIERRHHESQCIDTPLWTEDDLPAREFYWDRARTLSVRAQRERKQRNEKAAVELFRKAASLYERCRDLFPPVDSYTAHYWAYNLENGELDGAEEGYRDAVRLDPSNPWWNARLVSFLLRDGRSRAAKQAWEEALAAIDPNGDRLEREPGLAFHLHHWVARAWLDAGRPREAAKIVVGLPRRLLRESHAGRDSTHTRRLSRLRRLLHDVASALEAEALGQSVYPRDFMISARWRIPDALRDDDTVEHWFPGRVVRAQEDRIDVVYALPRGPGPEQEVLLTSFTGGEWAAEAGDLAAEADRFVFLVSHRGDRRQVLDMTPPRHSLEELSSREESEAALRAIRQWLSP